MLRRFANRFVDVKGHHFEQGFKLQLRDERLKEPPLWRKPRIVFVNSMSDLFHEEVPVKYINSVFEVMEAANRHTFQVLTKRSSLMLKFVERRYHTKPVPPHIRLGVSVENQQAKSRIRHLQAANATIRFLSIEPLIEDVGDLDLNGIHWVIVGGESGPLARAMNLDWARRIRDACISAGVPFFFKQWGTWSSEGRRGLKSRNGRLLDGRTWDEMPPAPPALPVPDVQNDTLSVANKGCVDHTVEIPALSSSS